MEQKRKCPHCQSLLEFEKNAEDDGDRTFDIWKCIDKECGMIIMPFYYEYAKR